MGNKIIYHIAKVGDLLIGHNYPVRVQSMVNTNTSDINATVNQIIELANIGCEIARITTRNIEDANLLYDIKDKLIQQNCTIPIIADIHFNPKAAIVAAQYAEKIRINPGNYIDKKTSKTTFTDKETKEILSKAKDNLSELTEVCKKYNTAIRIGSNHGSLSNRIINKYGNTAIGMVESVVEFINIFKELEFYNLVLSLKSSNPLVMLQANRLLYDRMKKTNEFFPIHLGVTEAGAGADARIKSAIGIGALLYENIGDTIRVSLSENPINEIVPAKIIANIKETYNNFSNNKTCNNNIACNNKTTCNNGITYSKESTYNNESTYNKIDNLNIKFDNKPKIVNIDFNLDTISTNDKDNYCILDSTELDLTKTCELVNNNKGNKKIILKKFYKPNKENNSNFYNNKTFYNLSEEFIINTSFEISYILLHLPIYAFETNIDKNFLLDILQATKIKLTKPEYISCPTCGRTEYDLISILEDVKEKTKHLKDITIGVMGCIVNGPGEMLGADYGVVGFGKDKVVLYKNGEKVSKPIDTKDAANKLLDLIEKNVK